MSEAIAKISASLRRGFSNFRWYARVIGQRMRAEASLIQMLRQAEDLKEVRDLAARTLSYRLLEIRDDAVDHVVAHRQQPLSNCTHARVRRALKNSAKAGSSLIDATEADKASSLQRACGIEVWIGD